MTSLVITAVDADSSPPEFIAVSDSEVAKGRVEEHDILVLSTLTVFGPVLLLVLGIGPAIIIGTGIRALIGL